MLRVQRSPSSKHNQRLASVSRKARQDNAAYVAGHAATSKGTTNLVLLGGVGPVDFRLRVAQAHVRDDLAPSAWSHVLLMGPPAKVVHKTPVHEVGLYGSGGAGYPPETNGVSEVPLGAYASAAQFPNVAVLSVPVPYADVLRAIKAFRTYRSTLDALEHLLSWWGFVWGVGRAANPLHESIGVPSAVFAETVLASLGYDLVPGFPSRASCPESIWLSARWWFEIPRTAARSEANDAEQRAISGVYDAEHYLVPRVTG